MEAALACWDTLMVGNGDRELGEPGPGYRTWKRTGHPFTRTWDSVPRATAEYEQRQRDRAERNHDDNGDGDGDGDGDDDDER